MAEPSSVLWNTDFNPTIGAFEIGVMVSMFLFGLVTSQVFSYFKKFPNDPYLMKAFVGAVWILELAHTALTAHSIYFITVVKYGQKQFINQFPVSLIAVVALSGIIGPAIQAFFADRLRRLCSSWIIPSICWIFSVLRCITLMAVAGAAYTSDSITDFREKWVWLLTSSLAISTAADMIIAFYSCYYLWQRRDRGFKKTKRLVDQLILWTIQTGLLTSIGTVTMLILFVAVHNFAWMAVFFVISRLFSNSLVASLNARSIFRTSGDKIHFVGEEDSTFHAQSSHSRNINVTMTRITEKWITDERLQKTRVIDQDSES
ncbi:hypothetical protein E4T56_gene15195 [Termitomyces sp. T112]|nr:hypothetical protein E4T56_gene15195 [Termitomyces sp. T112]KAH0585519.1 hypothetical protein H2248_008755 [Termitomyces sp. 'cryptogamus']